MASSISANVGDVVKIAGVIEVVATGVDIDPSVVKGWTRSPAGTVTTYTYGTDSAVAKTATGNYTLTFDVDTAGTWWAGLYSTGTGKASSVDFRIDVQPSKRQ